MIFWTVLAAAALMMLVELVAKGRNWPRVRGWWARALALNLIQVGSVVLAGRTWDLWLQNRGLLDTRSLGTLGGAVFGYLTITFVYYWWHRWRHEIPLLWRVFHQIHHSPQRIEIITSFYKHPAEILANGFLSSAILYGICGLPVEAATQAILLTGLAELFYHWNVPTPRWLGYIVQRPESHCVHHQEGLHHYNYADLPLWDMLFGTFRNPKHWGATCGFGGQREHMLAAMLLGRDVNADGAAE